MLSARTIYGEIFDNDEAFRLFCSIAAGGEAQGGWENGRIAALVPGSQAGLAAKITRHGADEDRHGRIFAALLRKRGLEPVPVPADADYTMRLEAAGIGLAHTRLRRDEELTEAGIVTYLAHSRVTEQRASEQMRALRRHAGDRADIARAVRVISNVPRPAGPPGHRPGAVITADALHAQREHATYLARRGAHYLLIVKRNQPSLHAQLAVLPWREVPVAHTRRERGHGRTERRTLKVTSVAAGLAFLYAARAIQITRRRKLKGKWSRETCYAVTSLALTQASYTQLAAIIRGHWGIEDRRHWVRDLDWDEDRSQARTASGPRIMASLRNLVITILRLTGATCIAARPALPRPAARPAPPDDHAVLTGSAGAQGGRRCQPALR